MANVMIRFEAFICSRFRLQEPNVFFQNPLNGKKFQAFSSARTSVCVRSMLRFEKKMNVICKTKGIHGKNRRQ